MGGCLRQITGSEPVACQFLLEADYMTPLEQMILGQQCLGMLQVLRSLFGIGEHQRLSREMKPCVCLCISNVHLPSQLNRLGAETKRGLYILHFLVNPGKSNSQTRCEVSLA